MCSFDSSMNPEVALSALLALAHRGKILHVYVNDEISNVVVHVRGGDPSKVFARVCADTPRCAVTA